MFRVSGGVPGGMRNPAGLDDAIRAHRQGDRGHRGDDDGRQPGPFDFFDQRCAATRSGASGGRHDHAVDALGFHLLGHGLPDGGGIGDGHAAADGRKIALIKLPELVPGFEGAQAV